MLTPDDESYKMKAHKVMVYALTSTLCSFFSGVWLASLYFKRSDIVEIVLAIGMVAASVVNGWKARSDFKKLVSAIPQSS
jgi:hypothetical protein